jgi:hypothetical protein
MSIFWLALHKLGMIKAVRCFDLNGYCSIMRSRITPSGRCVAWWCGSGLTLHSDGRLGDGFYSWDRWESLQ